MTASASKISSTKAADTNGNVRHRRLGYPALCLKDEESAWTISLLRRLSTGDRIVVPAHWPTEVSNGLLMATRRKRIPEGRAALFWDELAVLPITVEAALTPVQAKAVLALCDQYRLTVYDAAYLELAKRKALPLATLDDALGKAAIAEAISLVG